MDNGGAGGGRIIHYQDFEDLPIGIFCQEGHKLAITITQKHSTPHQPLYLPITHHTSHTPTMAEPEKLSEKKNEMKRVWNIHTF